MNNHNANDVDELLDQAIGGIKSLPVPRESRDTLLENAASWPTKNIIPSNRPFVRLAILASLAASLLLVAGGYPFLAPVASVKDDSIRRGPTLSQVADNAFPELNPIEGRPFRSPPYMFPPQKQIGENHEAELHALSTASSLGVAVEQGIRTMTPIEVAEVTKDQIASFQLENAVPNGPATNEPAPSTDDWYLGLRYKRRNSHTDNEPTRPGPVAISGIPVNDETPLEPGLELLVEYHGQLWRGQVKEMGPGNGVAIRYIGWEESWDEVVPRTRLQLSQQSVTSDEIGKGIPSTPDNLRPWGPEQVLGPPNTPEAGDKPTAWASLTPDNSDEWLILEYDQPVNVVAILIYETFNPGALSKIHLWNEENQETLVWTGNPIPAPEQKGQTTSPQKRVVVTPTQVDFATKTIRLDLASKTVRGWNEIDAVGLVDEAGVTHWATSAVASSSYAVQQVSSKEVDDNTDAKKAKSTPLADAVRAFNQNAANDPIGKDQPPLTEESVIAAIRWSTMEQKELQLTDETIRILDKIIRTRRLPKGFTLEYISRFEPNDHTQFDAWSVRLRVPGGTIQNGTTCIMIENRMIRSQTAGPREREVIEKWRKRNEGRPIGFGSLDDNQQRQFKQYIKDREKAAEQDRAEQR